jgi:hypothetical protein
MLATPGQHICELSWLNLNLQDEKLVAVMGKSRAVITELRSQLADRDTQVTAQRFFTTPVPLMMTVQVPSTV